MTVWKKHTAARRHPAWAFVLTLLVGLLLWLVAASLVRGLQNAAAAEPERADTEIAFTPAPAVALQTPAAQLKAISKESKPDRKKSGGKREDGKSAEEARQAEFSPEEESAVQEFVAANHPELGQVLGSLKKKHAREYARAINDLSHTQSRLEQIRRNDEERYRRDLEAWQMKSRIQLLVARIKMNPDDKALRAELKQVAAEQLAQQRDQLTAERERLKLRLEKVDVQLEKLSSETDVQVEQRMKQWLTTAENSQKSNSQRKKDLNKETSPVKANRTKAKAQQPTETVRTDLLKDSQP